MILPAPAPSVSPDTSMPPGSIVKVAAGKPTCHERVTFPLGATGMGEAVKEVISGAGRVTVTMLVTVSPPFIAVRVYSVVPLGPGSSR